MKKLEYRPQQRTEIYTKEHQPNLTMQKFVTKKEILVQMSEY